jgi:hypothetical protein
MLSQIERKPYAALTANTVSTAIVPALLGRRWVTLAREPPVFKLQRSVQEFLISPRGGKPPIAFAASIADSTADSKQPPLNRVLVQSPTT